MSHPFVLIFIVLAVILFISSLFIKMKVYIPVAFGITLIIAYTITALLLGINYLEMIITLLIPVIILLSVTMIKEKIR